MPKCLIKIKDLYFEWSTVVEAPVTYGMSEKLLRQYIKKQYGSEGLRELPRRLERANLIGTSSKVHQSIDDLIEVNRAGDDETSLTEEEIYDRYKK